MPMQEVQGAADPLILREMREGELLLWSGRPDPRRLILSARQAALEWSVRLRVAALLSAAFAALISFLLKGRLPGGNLVTLLLLFGVLLLLYSLARTWPRLAAERANRERLKRTRYAITSQRVLVITTGRDLGVLSYTRQDLGRIERVERSDDGWGEVIFGPPQQGRGGQGQGAAARFVGIPNVREVETLLLQTFKEGEGAMG